MKKLNFGIIGCSRIAIKSVIPAIQKSEYAQVEIIGSRNILKSKDVSKQFSCKKFGNYEDVINDPKVDVVYISTPIGTHEKWVILALSKGKHVYCEKSSTFSFNSAEKMVETAKKNNVRLIEGFMFRFHSQHRIVKEMINDNKIGNLKFFQSNFGFPSFPLTDIRFSDKVGGGFLNDSGCYPISACRMIFEEEPISVFFSKIDETDNIDVMGVSTLVFQNNKFGICSYGNDAYYQSKYEIWGTNGVLSLDRAFSVPPDFSPTINLQYDVEKTWEGRKIDVFSVPPEDHFKNLIDTFCAEIQKKHLSKIYFEEELLKQAKIMEALRLSSQKNCMIFINEL